MNRATFFKHFELLADQPDAVAKMRELVLRLAISGRLCRQESTASWECCTLGEVGEWGSGGTPLKTYSEYYGGDIPWLIIRDLNDAIVTTARTHITQAGLKNSSATLLPKDVLLVAMYGSIGKLGITGIECATNQAIAYCIPDSKRVALRFLFIFLRAIRGELLGRGQGLAQQNISQKILKSVPVKLPPLAEQRRIVAKVDELMALCDELEQRQQARQHARGNLTQSAFHHLTSAKDPAEFRHRFDFILQHSAFILEDVPQLRQAILQLAVQGRLVPQNPKDEIGAKLVARLSRKELPDADHILDEKFPTTWGITAFTNLAHIRSGVTKGRNLAGRKTKSFPYLRVANVQRGHLDLEVMKDIEIPVEELEKFRLQPNDLLITEGGDWDKVGRTAIWRSEITDCIHQNHVFRARLVSSELQPEWFMLYFNSPMGRRYFEAAAKQTTNLASINATELRECPVPIPPLAEQKRIVARVEELLRWCDTLAAQLHQTRTLGAHLLASTLHHLLAA